MGLCIYTYLVLKCFLVLSAVPALWLDLNMQFRWFLQGLQVFHDSSKEKLFFNSKEPEAEPYSR